MVRAGANPDHQAHPADPAGKDGQGRGRPERETAGRTTRRGKERPGRAGQREPTGRPSTPTHQGTSRKPPDQQPEAAAGTHRPHDGGSPTPAPAPQPGKSGKTTTGSPSPAARAAEAQEPEPKPETQETAGRNPTGQGEETKTTKPAPDPDAAQKRTQAADRSARAATRGPRNDEARKTTGRDPNETEAERTKASAPAAQPTETPRPPDSTERTQAETSGRKTRGKTREPPKPTKATTANPPKRTKPAKADQKADRPAPHRTPARPRPRTPDAQSLAKQPAAAGRERGGGKQANLNLTERQRAERACAKGIGDAIIRGVCVVINLRPPFLNFWAHQPSEANPTRRVAP